MFDKLGLEDVRFADFLTEFKESLHSKVVDGTTYDEANAARNTKDKKIIFAKLEILESLMSEYFGEAISESKKCA